MVTVTKMQMPVKKHSVEECVDEAIRQRLMESSYAFTFRMINWQFCDGTLCLEGSVPSFYFKQILQELLRGVQHVEQIKNNVEVVGALLQSQAGSRMPAGNPGRFAG